MDQLMWRLLQADELVSLKVVLHDWDRKPDFLQYVIRCLDRLGNMKNEFEVCMYPHWLESSQDSLVLALQSLP